MHVRGSKTAAVESSFSQIWASFSDTSPILWEIQNQVGVDIVWSWARLAESAKRQMFLRKVSHAGRSGHSERNHVGKPARH